MTRFKWQSIVQFEYDSTTGKTRVLKAFTRPIGNTAGSGRQRGAKKIELKGATASTEVIL